MMRIAVFLMVILAGCAGMDEKWTKPDSKPQDFDVDNAQCEKWALTASNAINTMHTMVNYAGCMKAKGWTPPEKPKEEHEAAKPETAKNTASKHESPKEETSKH